MPKISSVDDIIELNVGGTELTTTRATICHVKGSFLAAMFSGRWQNDYKLTASAKIFLNYNPILFAEIINYFQQCIYQCQIKTSDREHVPAPNFEYLAEAQQVILSSPPIEDDNVKVVNFMAQHCKGIDIQNIIKSINKPIDVGVSKGKPLIIVAASEGCLDVVKYLLQHEADVDAVDESSQSALWWASCNDHADCLKVLIDFCADVNKCDVDGRTPTHITAESAGHVECLRILIDFGADVNECNDIYGSTPICIAAENGQAECLKVLIDFGADVNKCDVNGFTPTYIAAQNGHAACLKVLIDFGADVNKYNTVHYEDYFSGWTPTYVAAHWGHANCIQMLFDAQANILAPIMNGQTPLDVATSWNRDSCVQLLKKLMNNKKRIE